MEVAPPLLRWEGCISRGQHCPTIPSPLSDGWNVRPWVEISTLNIALGNCFSREIVERMDHRDLFPVVQSAARLLHHLAGIFREQSQPPHPRGLRLTVDKKLWRKIREKKIAMGHKPDDHEEPTITM